MKKNFLCFLAGLVMLSMLSSCVSMKKDCQGAKHYKLKNGIYI